MAERITLIQGPPDPRRNRFGHALADTYAKSAAEAGHEVRLIDVGRLNFPLLRPKEDFASEMPLAPIRQAPDTIEWAEHLVILYPLWVGTMPALLKAFLEQVFCPTFAVSQGEGRKRWKKQLMGTSARVVVTMGMPAFVYRWNLGAHGLKSLERNILAFSGIGPIKETLIGTVEATDGALRQKSLDKMHTLGRRGR